MDGGDVNNAPASCTQIRQQSCDGPQGAGQIHVHDPGPRRLETIIADPSASFDAGVVDEDGRRPKRLANAVGCLHSLVRVDNVPANRDRTLAERIYFARNLFGRLTIDVSHTDPCPGNRHPSGNGSTITSAGSRHHSNLSCEQIG